jgi:hypothetical protein
MLFTTSGLSQFVFPTALILLGIYLIVKRSGLLPLRRDESFNQDDNPSQEK